METYHKIQTLFKRDLDGSITGQKGKMIEGSWTTPELEYLADNEWTFSAKVDGTNIRIGWNGLSVPEFAGRSDNAVIPTALMRHLENKFDSDLFWDAFSTFNAGTKVVLFGEGYGPKIQGGGKYRNDHSFILFDVKIGDFWLRRKDVADVASQLRIDSVPEIGRGTLYDAINIVKSGLKSQWGDFYEEGIVARPVVEMFDRSGQRIITKVKHVDLHSQ